MTALTQLAGRQFGLLTVLNRAPDFIQPNGRRRTAWRCRCACGVELRVRAEHLLAGRSQSCGCRQPEAARRANTTNGHYANGARSPEAQSWRAMKARCEDLKNIAYSRYAGQGVVVCDRWRNSLDNFVADMGPRPPGTSLDRIDPYGSYEPSNCRWATPHEQRINRRIGTVLTRT